MNESEEQDCGCDCDMCRASKHEHCTTGMCELKDQHKDMDEEEQ